MSNKKLTAFAICVLLFAVCASIIGYRWALHIRNAGQMETIQQEAFADTSSDASASQEQPAVAGASRNCESNDVISVSTAADTKKVDFKKLQASNPDLFAWIRIPDTSVDYPVAQHPSDDTYYLNHGADGIYSEYGCPYIEQADGQSFTEFNTVIYGHNMNDGSMFGALHKFEDADYLQQHRELLVYTPEHTFTYQIFAAVMYSDKHIPYYYDDSSEEDRTAFLKSLQTDIVKKCSQYLKDVKVTAQDHILTLSTCDRKLRSNRYLVVAVMTQVDGTSVNK